MIGLYLFEYLYERIEGRKYSDYWKISAIGCYGLVLIYAVTFAIFQWLIPDEIEGLGLIVSAIIVGLGFFDVIFWGGIDIWKHDWEMPDDWNDSFLTELVCIISLVPVLVICLWCIFVGLSKFLPYIASV